MTYHIVKDPDGVLCVTNNGGDTIARGSEEMADLVDILMLALRSIAIASVANLNKQHQGES